MANPTEFTAAVLSAQPGDTITMAKGWWYNADLLFKANGTRLQPIILRPQTAGQVMLSGASRLRIVGNYLSVNGLVFTNAYHPAGDVIEFQETFSSVANFCRLNNCVVENCNPPWYLIDTKWVAISGVSNRVDHCLFKGKSNVGTLLVVKLPAAGGPNYNLIDHNWFGWRPDLGLNGGEIVRVGDSATSFNISRTIVEHNYFENCNGEVEVISSKSCENVYRYNTFIDCQGALTFRHGNRCTAEGNYFFGHNLAFTGGVRIMGEDHRVINNYFQDLGGNETYSALTLMMGLENSPLNGFFQVKNALIAFNTFVNCSNSIVLGMPADYLQYGTNRQATLRPLNCTFANNVVRTTRNKLVDQRNAPINPTWSGNIMFGTTLGISLPNGITLTDPKLVLGADALWRPGPNSPALGAAQGNYNDVRDDIKGCMRPNAKDVGCDQLTVAPPSRRPLTPADVGPFWFKPFLATAVPLNRPHVSLRWPTVAGASYQVQATYDLVTWTEVGSPLAAQGAQAIWEELLTPVPGTSPASRLYRVQRLGGTGQQAFSLSLRLTNRPSISVQWNCLDGGAYQVQVSTNLLTWQDVGPVIVPVERVQVFEESHSPISGMLWSNRFYRIKQLR